MGDIVETPISPRPRVWALGALFTGPSSCEDAVLKRKKLIKCVARLGGRVSRLILALAPPCWPEAPERVVCHLTQGLWGLCSADHDLQSVLQSDSSFTAVCCCTQKQSPAGVPSTASPDIQALPRLSDPQKPPPRSQNSPSDQWTPLVASDWSCSHTGPGTVSLPHIALVPRIVGHAHGADVLEKEVA